MKSQMKLQSASGRVVQISIKYHPKYVDGDQILTSTMLGATGPQFWAWATWTRQTPSWITDSCLGSTPLDRGWDSSSLATQGLDGLELPKQNINLW